MSEWMLSAGNFGHYYDFWEFGLSKKPVKKETK